MKVTTPNNKLTRTQHINMDTAENRHQFVQNFVKTIFNDQVTKSYSKYLHEEDTPTNPADNTLNVLDIDRRCHSDDFFVILIDSLKHPSIKLSPQH